MTKITVRQLTEEEKRVMGIAKWPVWTKEVSEFDWFYDSRESCQILEGRAVISGDGQQIEINSGDFVVFPKGLKCVWKITEPIRKHYNFD